MHLLCNLQFMNLNYRKALTGNGSSAHSQGASTGYISNKFSKRTAEPNVDAIRLQGIQVSTATHTEFDQGISEEKTSFEEHRPSQQSNMV